MCFDITKDSPKSKVAEKNITCYKTGYKNGGEFDSVYQRYTYMPNRSNPKVKFTYWRRRKHILQGYHSYTCLTIAKRKKFREEFVGKFIIPKGATYYKNKDEREYVSNQIIFKGFIK